MINNLFSYLKMIDKVTVKCYIKVLVNQITVYIMWEGILMNNKKEKYYVKSVGIDSDNKLFLVLPNGESIYISPE